jgi:hypothetical protein
MVRNGTIGSLLAFGALALLMPPAAGAERVTLAQAAATPDAVQPDPETRAQARRRPRAAAQPRARIRVYSRYPYRRYHSIYPLPYPIEYPGPHAVRHCTSHYEVERRLSGDVVVPRMRCWWAPG